MAAPRILIVDDDAELRAVVDQYLASEGFQTLQAADGDEAIRLWEEQRPDLLVLDWMMPGRNGLDVARHVHGRGRTPIIMLTARSDEVDLLLGLELGADDYLTKPFRMRELVARIRAVLRRTAPDSPSPAETLTFGDLVIDLAAVVVTRRGEPVNLTPTEFKLLAVLAQNPNQVFSRLQLMEKATGDNYDGFERTVDSHLNHLRRKLGEHQNLIQTVKGFGFKLVPPRG